MPRRIKWAFLVGSLACAVPLTFSGVQLAAQNAARTNAVAQRPVDFNWDVRPILSDNCFKCHGRDEKARTSGLRLDLPDTALAELKGGRPGRHAVVPGHPDDSELVRRITAPTPGARMPPPQANKTLTPEQIDILKRWIEQGAEYKPHWAYIPPVKPTLPLVKAAGRVGNDIDRFILSRLEREDLSLSPEADKETLINRVSLTLTGLPPTLPEVDAFLKDTSKTAYEKVVDRLLASPAYGEHMAENWMNVARYAESDGFLDDLHDRLFWPYRDWVISAFNKNMRYDQFATWQLAGDLMPSHTKEQTLATAFLRVGKRTTENGAIDEEYRVEYVIDRTNTVGTAFLGLTVGCARCHDHKYDPISQKDFYSLGGFFNSTDEPGFYAPGRSGVTAGPTLAWTDAATDAKLAAADAAIRTQQAAYDAARAAALRDQSAKVDALLTAPNDLTATVQKSIASKLIAYYPFDAVVPIPDDKLPQSRPIRRPSPPALAPETRGGFGAPPPAAAPPLAAPPAAEATGGAPAIEAAPQGGQGGGRQGGPGGQGRQGGAGGTGPAGAAAANAAGRGRGLPADLVRNDLMFSPSGLAGVEPAFIETPLLREGVKGKALFFNDTNRGFLAANVGAFERTQPFSIDFWVLAGKVYDDSTVVNHREEDASGNAGYDLHLEKNHLRFDVMHSRAGNMIRVLTKQTVPVKQWTHVTVTYDGSSQAKGIGLYIDGVLSDVDVQSDNLTRTIVANGGGTLGSEFLGFAFGKRFRQTGLVDGALDELRLFDKQLTPLEVAYLQGETVPQTQPGALKNALLDVLVANDPRVVDAGAKLSDARQAQNLLISVVPEIMVMGDTPRPRPTYVLIRGQYTDHGEQVTPRGLGQIFPWKESLPQNRLGLAQWLFDPQNPLTSRVFVNRLWQMHFGRGLVETSEDFGSQGSIPSHPELLDWLAVTFRESGWDIKQLQKTIVMSSTYRQSSDVSDSLLKRDPRNELLARTTRVRLPAELVRDNALAASGLLVRKIGGPSVYPYQPEGIWDGLAGYTYPAADKMPADAQHRRSMYSFIKRNAPHPAMATFDLPDRGTSSVRRQTSNTPLQALALLDDPQYLEAYRALASEVLKTTVGTDARITTVFRLATRRRPHADELAALRTYYDAQVQRYAADKPGAEALVKVGVSPVDSQLDMVQLAALMNVTTAVMNTPDAYSLR